MTDSVSTAAATSGPTDAMHQWVQTVFGVDPRQSAQPQSDADEPTGGGSAEGGGPGKPAPPNKAWQIVKGTAKGVYQGGKSLVSGLADIAELIEPFTLNGQIAALVDPSAPTAKQSLEKMGQAATGLGHVIAHPVDTYDATKAAVQAYRKEFLAELATAEQNGTEAEFYSQFAGRAGFETVMLLIPATKAGAAMKAMKAATELKNLTESAAVVEKANLLVKGARVAEPALTKSIQGTAERVGGEMIGLNYRLKTEKSLARKIATDMRKLGLTAEQAAGDVADAVRYTASFPPDKLVAGAEKMLAKLKADGCKVKKLKNTWLKPESSYKGVNVQLEDAKGQVFELQFHTPASFHAKDVETHAIYEKMRLLKIGSPKWKALNAQQMEIARKLEVPKGIETLKDIP